MKKSFFGYSLKVLTGWKFLSGTTCPNQPRIFVPYDKTKVSLNPYKDGVECARSDYATTSTTLSVVGKLNT